MGLFNIFKKPIYEKYGGLIYALKEHYQSLRITKTEASVFSMTANNCGNIDNLNITIYIEVMRLMNILLNIKNYIMMIMSL